MVGCTAFHDETLDRVTAASGHFAPRSSGYVRRLRVGGEPVPTLAEALEAYPEARYTVDLKDAAAIEPLVTTLRRSRAAARVCVAGAWDGWIRAVQEQVPEVSTALGWRSLTALIGAGRVGLRPPRAVATAPFAHVAIRLGRMPVLLSGSSLWLTSWASGSSCGPSTTRRRCGDCSTSGWTGSTPTGQLRCAT